MRFFLLSLLLMMPPSCAPWVAAGSDKQGNPKLIVSGGFAHQLKAGAITAKNNGIEVSMVLEEADGTEVIKTVSGDIVTTKGVDAYYGHENKKVDTDGKIKINESNNALKGKESDNLLQEKTFVPPTE